MIVRRFPNGDIVFDSIAPAGVRLASRMVRKSGISGAEMKWGIRKTAEIENWCSGLKMDELIPNAKLDAVFKKHADELGGKALWDHPVPNDGCRQCLSCGADSSCFAKVVGGKRACARNRFSRRLREGLRVAFHCTWGKAFIFDRAEPALKSGAYRGDQSVP